MERPFHFRKFSMLHARSTMKIGTDAVLLASWETGLNPNSILEIGTGSGIIALLLAQGFPMAEITAVDIDAESVDEAAENFRRSAWSSRLQAIHADIRQFSKLESQKYELIISNPPFFSASFKSEKEKRNLARHTDQLSFDELAEAIAKNLDPSGSFVLVLPADQFESWDKAATKQKLKLNAVESIIPVEGMPPNRINMCYSFTAHLPIKREQFTIRKTDNQFTNQYFNRIKEYYLGII